MRKSRKALKNDMPRSAETIARNARSSNKTVWRVALVKPASITAQTVSLGSATSNGRSPIAQNADPSPAKN